MWSFFSWQLSGHLTSNTSHLPSSDPPKGLTELQPHIFTPLCYGCLYTQCCLMFLFKISAFSQFVCFFIFFLFWHLIVLLWKTWCSLGNRAYFLITYVELLKPSSGYSKKTNELNLYNWFNSITREFCVILQSCIHTFEHHLSSHHTCGRANQQKGERNDAFDLSKGQTLDWILLWMDFPCGLVLKTAEAFYPSLSLYNLSEVRESFEG